jgi:hypothetical protein
MQRERVYDFGKISGLKSMKKTDGTLVYVRLWATVLWVSIEEALSLPSASISACIAKLAQQHKISL